MTAQHCECTKCRTTLRITKKWKGEDWMAPYLKFAFLWAFNLKPVQNSIKPI